MVHSQTPLCSPPLALKRLRGWDDVDAEMEEIQLEDEAEKAAGIISVLTMFRMRSLRWQVISIIILMGGQQLSGVNAVRGCPGPGTAGSVQVQDCPRSRLHPARPHQPLGLPSRSEERRVGKECSSRWSPYN